MRPLLKATLTATATAVCLIALSSPALAGTYTVSACSPLSAPGAWTQVNTAGAGLMAGDLCGGPAIGPLAGGDQGALYAEDNLSSIAVIPDGSLAGWTFTAPPATTITAISYYRALSANSEPNLVSGLFQASGSPLEQCMIGTAFGSSIVCSMPNSQAPVTFTGLNTSSLFFGVACRVVEAGTTGCTGGGTIHYAQADLYSAQVTLSQTALPTLGQPTSALWGGGVVSGAVPVTFAATDPSGIAQALVRSDTGATLILASEPCDYTTAVPCPQLPGGSLSIDTTRIADGPHTFSVVVTDAAGNSQSATSSPVSVDNNGPPPPTAFTATPAAGANNVINLSWRNPAATPAPVTSAMLQLCQASCAAAVSVSATGSAQITAPSAGAYSLRLWLLDTQGRGGAQNAAHASVTILAPGGHVGDGPHPTTGPTPGTTARVHTKIAATIHGRQLRITGTLAAIDHAAVKVNWRSRSLSVTLASGSRNVTVHGHKLALTFTLSHTARTGAIHVAVRSGTRILTSTLARPR